MVGPPQDEGTPMPSRPLGIITAALLALVPASAQTTDIDAFKDAPGKDDAKLHTASGFVCPLFVARFQRDAFGERDPSRNADFCAYSARDGVYGTITLTPLSGNYDPKAALAADFAEQEGTGGKLKGEATVKLGGKTPITVYQRTYETSVLESDHYRILFAGGTVGQWAVEATVEFVTPRDDDSKNDFLNAVYAEALAHIAKLPQGQPQTTAPSPVAAPDRPR
jgi:hypothetical protein